MPLSDEGRIWKTKSKSCAASETKSYSQARLLSSEMSMIIKRNGTGVQSPYSKWSPYCVRAWKIVFYMHACLRKPQKKNLWRGMTAPGNFSSIKLCCTRFESLRQYICSLIGPLMCVIPISDSSGVLQCGQVAHIRLRLWSNKRH